MYRANEDAAEFYIVYIREAHAANEGWPVPYAERLGIKQAKTTAQRCEVADRLVKEKKLTIPILIDRPDNTVGEAYAAWPDRIYAIGVDGRLAICGGRGPRGFEPGLADVEAWLKKCRKNESGNDGRGTAASQPGQRPPAASRPAGSSGRKRE